jgi:hypothetical protein
MEVFNELINVMGCGSAQNAGTIAVCPGVRVGIAVNADVAED